MRKVLLKQFQLRDTNGMKKKTVYVPSDLHWQEGVRQAQILVKGKTVIGVVS